MSPTPQTILCASVRAFLLVLLTSFAGASAVADVSRSSTITLLATSGFPVREVPGFAATRIERDKGVISVDGDITGYAFGMAQTRFVGEDGVYDITLATVQDSDGVCDYFLRIGKGDTPTFRQTGTTNGTVETHTWKDIVLRRGDLLGVAGNGSDTRRNSPGKGPKGFHMAHGRWSKLTLVRTGPIPHR